MPSIFGFVRDQEQGMAVLDALLGAGVPEDAISVVCIERQRHRHGQILPLSAPLSQSIRLGIGDPLGWFPGLDLLLAPGIGAMIASGPALALLHSGRSKGISGLLEDLGMSQYRARLHATRLRYGDILIVAPVSCFQQEAAVRSLFKDRAVEDIGMTLPSTADDHLPATA